MLHHVRALIHLRKQIPALGTDAAVRVLREGYPFIYLRGEEYLVVVNGRREPADVPMAGIDGALTVAAHRVELIDGTIHAAGFSYGIFRLASAA